MRFRELTAFVSALAAIVGIGSPAYAEDLCRAKALRDVSPNSGGNYVIAAGDYVTAVTQYEIDPETGRRSFCSHGGGCYPETVTVAGRGEVKALVLENCIIGRQIDHGLYAVEIDRSLNSAADLRFNDIEDRLIDIGMGVAPADNAARHYVKNPSGPCGRLVLRALEGDHGARRALISAPEFCRFDYGTAQP